MTPETMPWPSTPQELCDPPWPPSETRPCPRCEGVGDECPRCKGFGVIPRTKEKR